MDAPLAQLVEHLTLNQGVQGSSPWRCTLSTVFGVLASGAVLFLCLKIVFAVLKIPISFIRFIKR